VRPGNANANSYSYVNTYDDCYPYAHSYCYAYRNGDCNAYTQYTSNAYSYCFTNANGHADAPAYSYAKGDTKGSTDPALAADSAVVADSRAISEKWLVVAASEFTRRGECRGVSKIPQPAARTATQRRGYTRPPCLIGDRL
jgi:hypothetical protein